MKTFAILLCISIALSNAENQNLGTSALAESWRGFVDGIRENASTTGPCLDVIPQLEAIATNMTLRL